MGTVVDELVTILGFEVNGNAAAILTKFNSGVQAVSRFALEASAALTAIATGIAYFGEKSVMASAAIGDFHDRTGASLKSIQDWSYAIKNVGGSADEVKDAIETLQGALHEIKPGQYNEGLYWLLGPNYQKEYKDWETMALAISKKIQGWHPAAVQKMGSMMNLPPAFMLLLQKDPMAAISKSKFTLSPAQIAATQKFREAMNDVRMVIDRIGANLAADVVPWFTKLIGKAEKWVTVMQPVIKAFLSDFTKGVGEGLTDFGDTLKAVWKWVKKFIPDLKELVSGLSAKELTATGVYVGLTFLAVTFGIVYAKAILITGAIVGVVEVLRRLRNAKPGDAGFFGALATILSDAKEFLKNVQEVFQPIIDMFKPILDMLKKAKKDTDKSRAAGGMFQIDESGISRINRWYKQFKDWRDNPDHKSGPSFAEEMDNVMKLANPKESNDPMKLANPKESNDPMKLHQWLKQDFNVNINVTGYNGDPKPLVNAITDTFINNVAPGLATAGAAQ